MSQVAYLGHVLSGAGMIPDPQKIKVVQDWPVPQNTTAVRQFLGLASYYRWYIHHFSETAALLHALTQKGAPFNWSAECAEAFIAVKDHLTQAPVLAYPRFDHNAGTFYLQMLVQHAPLQWLSAQKMEGMLCRWALAIQEYDFEIIYRNRSLNVNARFYTLIKDIILKALFWLSP